MKKALLFLITSLLAAQVASAQTGWIDYKIGDKLSVKLPEQPTRLNENGVYVRGSDSTVYIVATVDFFKAEGLDSAKIAAQAPTAEFANTLKTGMLGQMQGTTLGDVKIGKWKGYTSYTIEGGNATNQLKFYTFMVFIGTNVYSLMAWVPENHDNKEKDDYFNSLVLN